MVVIQIGSLYVARQHELPVLHNTLSGAASFGSSMLHELIVSSYCRVAKL